MLKNGLALLAAVLVGAGGATAYFLGKHRTAAPAEKHDDHASHDHGGHDEGHPEETQEEGIVKLSNEARKAAGIRSAAVQKQNLAAVVTATATVRPNSDRLAHVGAKVTGRIVGIAALQGTQVKTGDPLLTLDSIEVGTASVDLLKARSALEVARLNFEREEGLLKRNATTAAAFYEAKAQHEHAKAEYLGARDRLLLLGWSPERVDALKWDESIDRSRIGVTAPIDGEVIEKHATLGEVIKPEDSLYTIADLSTVWVIIDVYQSDVRKVREGQEVEATEQGNPGRIFKGSVAYVGKILDEESRTLKVRVAISNPGGLLKPGMFVTARILESPSDHASEMLAIPVSSVQWIKNVPVAFILKAPGLYERRALTLGARFGDHYEVLAGLAAGELIVTEGSFILKSELLRSEMGHGHEH